MEYLKNRLSLPFLFYFNFVILRHVSALVADLTRSEEAFLRGIIAPFWEGIARESDPYAQFRYHSPSVNRFQTISHFIFTEPLFTSRTGANIARRATLQFAAEMLWQKANNAKNREGTSRKFNVLRSARQIRYIFENMNTPVEFVHTSVSLIKRPDLTTGVFVNEISIKIDAIQQLFQSIYSVEQLHRTAVSSAIESISTSLENIRVRLRSKYDFIDRKLPDFCVLSRNDKMATEALQEFAANGDIRTITTRAIRWLRTHRPQPQVFQVDVMMVYKMVYDARTLIRHPSICLRLLDARPATRRHSSTTKVARPLLVRRMTSPQKHHASPRNAIPLDMTMRGHNNRRVSPT